MRFIVSLLLLVNASVGFVHAQDKQSANWDGPLLKPMAPEALYEFTTQPMIKKVGTDRYEITFTSQGKCDVAVAVEDASGRIVRHLVYGVLGSNAPTPLKKDSLEQTLYWNGKDDFGKYVKDPEKCRVRVSLGLKPTFDKVIGWHGKDTIGSISGMGADADGVYVLAGGGYWNGIKMYGHDGHYIRTLLPFPADKLKDLKGVPLLDVPGAGAVPIRDRYGSIAPYPWGTFRAGAYQVLALSQGRLAFASNGHTITRQVMRIGTDGGTRGESPLGPIIGPGKTFDGASEMAVSPDGKWLYLTKLRAEGFRDYRGKAKGTGVQHAVFRMAWDDKGPLDVRNNVFIGEAVKADRDNDHLDHPEGVACDSQGRVYVSDSGNDRVQVFSPEGKYLTTIAAKWPRQIQVHQKTGDIYVMSHGPKNEATTLVKYSPLPNPKEVARLDVAGAKLGDGVLHDLGDFKSSHERVGFETVFCLDSWSTPAKVWMVPAEARIIVWTDRGDKFELAHDFDHDMRKDQFTPHAYNNYKMNRIMADPVRGHLYYVNSLATTFLRCDPESGKGWEKVKAPGTGGWWSIDELTFGLDGFLYMRTPTYLARFNPEKIVARKPDYKSDATWEIPVEAEVPFDYGEKQSVGYGRKEPYLQGVIKLPAQIRGNGFDMGMAVAPNGNILSICQNFQKQTDRLESKGTTVPKLEADRYRPAQFPGRLWNQGGLIWVWDKHGKMIGEDVVKSMHGASAGIRGDAQGNLFVGLSAHPLDKTGKLVLPRNDSAGPGALLKFPPGGGRIFGTWGDPVQLEKLPDRAPEFSIGDPANGGIRLWSQNLLWSYPGMSTMTIATNTCTCPQSRFDTDAYGRSFVPESWRYSVGVVDTNGNPVLHIGRYGNPDSGRGADSPVKVAGDIAFSQSDFVTTVTDRWLYVADTGNWRVVRIRLGYHKEQTASFAGLK